jgi:hypothetical protein
MNKINLFMIFHKKEKKRKLFFSFVFFFILNFTSAIYAQQTGCPNDFDCDGIIDILDVDDDNDGIYDHIESPGCFDLEKKTYETGDRREQLEVSTTLPYTSGTLEELVDGITTSGGITIPASTSLEGKEIFRLTTKLVPGIEYSSIIITLNAGIFVNGSKGILQGSNDGLAWSDLTDDNQFGTSSYLPVTIAVTKNQERYRYYRLFGTAGKTTSAARIIRQITGVVDNYMPSLYPKAKCEGEDLDGDGKPNHQDLDADGDGVSDVIEAGFSDPDKDGKLGDQPITVDQFGAVNSAFGYTIPYEYYKIAAIDATQDNDNDGVWDVFDLDDDNDGIYDHIESPDCFNMDKKIYETGDRREQLGVSSTLPYTSGNLEELIDGVPFTNNGITIPASTSLEGKEIFRLTTKLALGIEYSSIELYFSSYTFTSTTEIILQGSKDGTNWIPLTASLKPGSTYQKLTITIDTDKQDLYRHYRLWGIAGTTAAAAKNIAEITGVVSNYIPSLYPKAKCEGEDIDEDGKPNHQDLDADGDGAYDVLEAGFSDPDKDGKLGDQPITVDQFGAVNSAFGYAVPYEYYKIAAIDATKDTDNDGVRDIFDLDDDNDGIYDHIESPSCFDPDKKTYETGDRRKQLEVSTTLPYSSGTQEELVDGITVSGGIIIPASILLKDKEVFRLTTKLTPGIEYSSIKLDFNSAFFIYGSKGILQGSNDGFAWSDLTDDNQLGTSYPVTFTVTKNKKMYRIYRLLGTAGQTQVAQRTFIQITGVVDNYMPSLYPKAKCEGEDLDGDGIPNHQDSDTDGDGAYDVLEAGFSDPDKDGKLGGQPITVDQHGAVTSALGYTIPYEYYKIAAIDATKDTDNDGVWDIFDIDDDNDGIYDHIESPSCFDLDKKTYETGDRREQLGVSTTLPYTSGTLEELVNGVINIGGIEFARASSLKDREIFRLTTKLAPGIEYSSIVITLYEALFVNGSKGILQGSNDGLSWLNLTEDNPLGTSSLVTITVTKNQGMYRYYRLLGTAGTTTTSTSAYQFTREITGIVANYMPSFYSKMKCEGEGEDIDGDGIPNHQDLDTDDDGAFDVLEAGFSDPDGDGELGTRPVSVNPHGAVHDHGYIVPFAYYKMKDINITKDTDGDGVWDVFDVDDDNDGIYDHIESQNCFDFESTYETGNRREQLEVSTTLPYSEGSPQELLDEVTDTGGITIPALIPIANHEIFRLSTKLAMGIEYSSITLTLNAAIFTTGSKGVLQGSNDGLSWTDLTEDNQLSTINPITISVAKNQGLYRVYRLLGTVGTTPYSRTIREITGKVSNYMPSLYPKIKCEGEDIDGDGIPNHHDLNADGDTCYDVLEAGFLDNDRDGILGNSPVMVNENGKVTSAQGYVTPNNMYWLDNSKNVCTSEGIPENEDSHCSDLEYLNSDTNLAQSIFHSTIVSTKNGFSIFGQATNPTGVGNLLTPTPMTPENGFTYEGEIRLATLAGQTGGIDASQYFILSTKGLYAWGPTLSMAIPSGWTPSRGFSEIQLPTGIAPENIKNMTASKTNLVLLTKLGEVYIATGNYSTVHPAIYGDGSTVLNSSIYNVWHKANINQVVSIKINSNGQALALTLSGELYTWGPNVYLGDASAYKTFYVPTKMTLPSSITKVKMTALTHGQGYNQGATYFALGENKRVYSLGGGANGILGVNSLSPSSVWQTVKSPSGTGAGTGTGYLENIKFITATLHDNTAGAAGTIDEDGIPYFWGENGASRLGSTGGNVLLPRIPDGITTGFHNIIAVEMGGHVTPIIDQKLGKFGYIGHLTSGSMGIPGSGTITSYDFENTPEVDFCNIVIGNRKKIRVTVNPMNINTTIKKIKE